MDPAALKAAGFSDDEIAAAQSDQAAKLKAAGFSDDEIKAATVAPVTVTAPPAPQRSFLGLLRNAGSDANNIVEGLYNLPGNALKAVTHPGQTLDAARSWTDHAADILRGGVEEARQAITGDDQSLYPTQAFDQFTKGIHDQYLTKQGLYEHPLGPALAVGSVAVPALKASGVADALGDALAGVGGKVADAAANAPVIGPVTDAVRNVATAERRGNMAAEVQRLQMQAALEDQGAAATADAASASTAADALTNAAGSVASDNTAATATRAKRLDLIAKRLGSRGAALNADAAAQRALSTPPDLDIGTPATPTDIGNTVRVPATASQDTIDADMRAKRAEADQALQAVIADRAAAGVGVADTLEGQSLLAKSKAIVEPDPVNRPSVGNTPMDSAGGKLHQMVVDTLQPPPQYLTPAQAFEAQQQGQTVLQATAKNAKQLGLKEGDFYKIIKPSYSNVDDLRRFMQQVANGQVEGFKGIGASEAMGLYKDLGKVLDEYTSGASGPVRAAWAQGKINLQPYENMKLGQKLVGLQEGVPGVFSTPAASIPGAILSGGQDAVAQLRSVAGPEATSAAVRSIVQNELAGKNATQIGAALKPGSRIGDLVSSDPDLASAVADYHAQVQNAEAAGAQAAQLSSRASRTYDVAGSLRDQSAAETAAAAAANEKTLSTAQQAAQALRGQAADATAGAEKVRRQLSDLARMPPEQVVPAYRKMLQQQFDAKQISLDQYNQGMDYADKADAAFKLKGQRDKAMQFIGYGLGVTAGGNAGLGLLNSALGGGH